MADQFQIPQRNPSYVAPVDPTPLVESYLNRPSPAQVATQGLANTGSQIANYQQYGLQKQIAASEALGKLFESGGPYAVSQYGAPLQRLLGGNMQAPPANTPGGPMPPTQPPPGPSGVVPGPGPQQVSTTPAQGGPPIDPMSPGGTIHTSVNVMGNPPHGISDAQSQLLSSYGLPPTSQGLGQAGAMGALGTKVLGGIKNIGEIEQQPIQNAKNAADLRASQAKFATPEQGAAIASADPNAIARAYGGEAPTEVYANAANKGMEVRKTIAGEVSKQSQDTQNINQLKTLASNLQQTMSGKDQGILANVKGDIYQQSGGRYGSKSAATMQNAANPLATALNTELARRFNSGEVQLLSDSLIPHPKDTPEYAQTKLSNLNRLIDSMASGNEQNVRNVAASITSGAIPKIGQALSSQTGGQQFPAINNKSQYDALPNGTSYSWNGQHHIKGRS